MWLGIIELIHTHPDWEPQLAGAPYFVKTKREGRFVLLKYDQIRSDMTNPVVRECRGIILDESGGYCPACVPFYKFGNFGESYVPDIDWASARIQEKLDGSLIKKTQCPACVFALIDGKAQSPRDWLLSRPTDRVIEYIGIMC